MKKLSFVLAALLITGVAFGEKKCCKKGKAGKACCKKEASADANVDGGNAANTVTLNNAAPAPKACCKKGGDAAKACCKKGEAGKACSKDKAAAAPAEAPATK